MDSKNNDFGKLINQNNDFSSALRKMLKYLESKSEDQKDAISKVKKSRNAIKNK